MTTIWKFPLQPDSLVVLEMPRGARLLTVQVQGAGAQAEACLWALVDPHTELVKRGIVIRGTGHHADGCEHLPYISTFQFGDGSLVFHAFDAGERG